jgi:hypothetical protein
VLLCHRDGLVRIAFTRKNKTLGAIFRQSRTLQLLEANHAVVQVRPLLLCSLYVSLECRFLLLSLEATQARWLPLKGTNC